MSSDKEYWSADGSEAHFAEARFQLGQRHYVVIARELGAPLESVGELAIGQQHYLIFLEHDEPECDRADVLDHLSPRELEIAYHIAAGRDCKVVARHLKISFHTVRVHLGRIYAKLGLHKQTELAALVAARFAPPPPLPFVGTEHNGEQRIRADPTAARRANQPTRQ
jgi:DNA-binding CsgD family transcriptional regulator